MLGIAVRADHRPPYGLRLMKLNAVLTGALNPTVTYT